MKGSVWAYVRDKDSVEYRFQVDGITRGVYTKVIDPVFKDWREVGSGVNYKKSTETLIFSRYFSSEDEVIKWVKSSIQFPTVFNSCRAKCTVKVLVADKDEGKNASTKGAKNDSAPKRGTVRKSKTGS